MMFEYTLYTHTTAGITINENSDHNVVHDMLFGLDRAFPDRAEFSHAEGTSAAHLSKRVRLVQALP